MSLLNCIPLIIFAIFPGRTFAGPIDELIKAVALGDAYPPGTVWLAPVTKGTFKPSTIQFINIDGDGAILDGKQPSLQKQSDSWKEKVSPEGRERFFDDESLDPCAQCALTRYTSSRKPAQHQFVVAVGAPFSMGAPEYDVEEKTRPLAEVEKKKIVLVKKADAKKKKEDCTTEPQYLDEAIQKVSFSIQKTPYVVRVSPISMPVVTDTWSITSCWTLWKKGSR